MSQQINLFNPIFLKQKKYFSAVAMLQALGLIVLGAVCISVYSGYQSSSVSKEEASTFAQLIVVQAELNKVNVAYAPHPNNQTIEDSVTKTGLEVKSLQQVFDTLEKGDIGNTKGYSAYLSAFSRQIVDGLWLTGFSIIGAGNEMDLRGRALRPELVPYYIGRLKNETVMQGKTFSALNIHAPQIAASNNDHEGRSSIAAPYVEFDLRSSGIAKEKTTSDVAPYTAPPSGAPSIAPNIQATPTVQNVKPIKPAELGGEKIQ